MPLHFKNQQRQKMEDKRKDLKVLADELLSVLSVRPTSKRIAADPDAYFEFIHSLETAAFKIRDFNNEQ